MVQKFLDQEVASGLLSLDDVSSLVSASVNFCWWQCALFLSMFALGTCTTSPSEDVPEDAGFPGIILSLLYLQKSQLPKHRGVGLSLPWYCTLYLTNVYFKCWLPDSILLLFSFLFGFFFSATACHRFAYLLVTSGAAPAHRIRGSRAFFLGSQHSAHSWSWVNICWGSEGGIRHPLVVLIIASPLGEQDKLCPVLQKL